MKRLLFFYLFSLCSSAIMAQNTIYVSSETKGIENGTLESPYQTIEAALKQGLNSTGNDTVRIHVQAGLISQNSARSIKRSG